MLNRWVEDDLLDALSEEGIGCIAFSPLAQGMLTSKYLKTVPSDSRAAKDGTALDKGMITEERLERIRSLNAIAERRGQTLAQMALAWVLRRQEVTSVLIGASSVKQVEENVAALDTLHFTDEELAEIDSHAVDSDINLWARSSSY